MKSQKVQVIYFYYLNDLDQIAYFLIHSINQKNLILVLTEVGFEPTNPKNVILSDTPLTRLGYSVCLRSTNSANLPYVDYKSHKKYYTPLLFF